MNQLVIPDLRAKTGYQPVIDNRAGVFSETEKSELREAVQNWINEKLTILAVCNPAHIVLIGNGGAVTIRRNWHPFNGDVEDVST